MQLRSRDVVVCLSNQNTSYAMVNWLVHVTITKTFEATCLLLRGRGIQLSAYYKGTESLPVFSSHYLFNCWASSREAVNIIFKKCFDMTRKGIHTLAYRLHSDAPTDWAIPRHYFYIITVYLSFYHLHQRFGNLDFLLVESRFGQKNVVLDFGALQNIKIY